MANPAAWDTELYEGQHSFVWKMGDDLLEILDPQPGERILDLGCGTGQLTSAIADRGATVLGLDASPNMIGQARQNFPRLQFVLQNAASMSFNSEFDAVFSNAALHWMKGAEPVAANMAKALRTGGRLVAEFGGKGNVQLIEQTILAVLARYVTAPAKLGVWYFPALGEYASLLEQMGLEVRQAVLFNRPTALSGERGMEQWLEQFANHYFEPLIPQQRREAIGDVVEALRPRLWNGSQWSADYRRLRVTAVKV